MSKPKPAMTREHMIKHAVHVLEVRQGAFMVSENLWQLPSGITATILTDEPGMTRGEFATAIGLPSPSLEDADTYDELRILYRWLGPEQESRIYGSARTSAG